MRARGARLTEVTPPRGARREGRWQNRRIMADAHDPTRPRPAPPPRASSLAGALGLAPCPRLARDLQFALALAAGPVAWGALLWVGLLPRGSRDWPALLMLVALQPLAEELVFRGVLQGWAGASAWGRRRFAGLSAANLAASAAFVAAHLAAQPPAWALAVALPSLVFGHFRDRHDSVWPAVALHAWYNAGFFLLPLALSR